MVAVKVFRPELAATLGPERLHAMAWKMTIRAPADPGSEKPSMRLAYEQVGG